MINRNRPFHGIKNSDGSKFTVIDYNKAYQRQNGLCAICGAHNSTLRQCLHADHDHQTGIFRGLLCEHCNKFVVGSNTVETVKKMKEYFIKAEQRA